MKVIIFFILFFPSITLSQESFTDKIFKNFKEKKLVLQCKQIVDEEKYNPLEVVYIWYRSNDSLDGSDGTSTPYVFNDDFKTTFLRKPLKKDISLSNPIRRIEFNDYKNTLEVVTDWSSVKLDNPDNWIQVKIKKFQCSVLEDNR